MEPCKFRMPGKIRVRESTCDPHQSSSGDYKQHTAQSHFSKGVPGTHSYKAPAEREYFDLFLNRTATHCRERSSSVGNRSRHARKKLRRRKDDSRRLWCLGACMRPVVFRGMCATTSAADTLALQHHTSFAGSESSLFHCDSIARLCRKRAVNRRLGAAGIGHQHRSAGLYIW